MWQSYINAYKNYLTLERSLAENSVEAYLHDVAKLWEYLELAAPQTGQEAPSPFQVK